MICIGTKAIVPASVAGPWLAEVRAQLQANPDCGLVDGPDGKHNQVRTAVALDHETLRPFATLLATHEDRRAGYALPLWIDAGSGLVAELSEMRLYYKLDLTTDKED